MPLPKQRTRLSWRPLGQQRTSLSAEDKVVRTARQKDHDLHSLVVRATDLTT